MKSRMAISIILVVGFFISCASRQNNPVEGTWQLVDGRFVDEDTTVTYPMSPDEKRMKIIGKTHFATLWQDTTQNISGFNGGTYTFEDGMYTEQLSFFSSIDWIGIQSIFLAEIEGDRLLLTPSNADGEAQQYGYFEEWERLD